MLTSTSLQSHHPILHTLLLDGLVLFGQNYLGSANGGVALYIGLQLVIVSATFTLMLRTMAEEGAGKILLTFSFVFLAINPALVLWLLTSTKDVLFTAFAMLLALLLYRAYRKKGKPLKLGFGLCLAVALLSFLFLAFRSAAVYSFVLFLACALLLLRKHLRIRLVGAMTVGLALFIGFSAVLYPVFNITAGPWQTLDALSMPRQQLARAWVTGQDEVIAQFKQVFTAQELSQLNWYQADDADTSRIAFKEQFEQNFFKLLELYVNQAQKHPDIYADAVLMTNYEAWYPGAMVDGYVMDGYYSNPDIARSSYIFTQNEWPSSQEWILPEFGIWLEQFGYGNIGGDIMAIRLLCSPASYVWLLLVALARNIIIRSRSGTLVCVFLLTIAAAALLSPLVVVRYYLPLIFAVPLVLHTLTRAQKPS
jgi:4-amino-4-deoxy-L-arabinose transferase-like glycosyltransferase